MIGAAHVGGCELRIAFDWFVVGEVTDRVVALKGEALLIDVNCFPGVSEMRSNAQDDGSED